MKWSGQHIYDLVSRFRDDVYLEDISTGTIAGGAHLGLDSNNKIVKASDGGGDLTAIVAGTGLSGSSLSGPIPTLNVDATQTQITGVGAITEGDWQGEPVASAYLDADTAHLTSIQTFSGAKTFTAGTTTFSSATADSPVILVSNTTDDDQAGQLIFEKLRDDDGVAQGQNLGEIWFRGQDSAQNTQNYAYIVGEIDVSTSGQESGQLVLGLANHDGGFGGSGLVLTGGSEDVEVDVTVGLGANSVTTIAGDLTVTSDLTVNGDTTTFSSSNADDPKVIIKNRTADNQGARLQFQKDRGAAMVQGDRIGEIDFIGEDADQNLQQYAKIMVKADVVTGGQESGQIILQVANHDGGLEPGLYLTGGSEDGEIDATIGLGANSVVTIPGDIDLAGDIDVDGTLETDALTIGGAAVLAQATASAVGAVELATTAEATTGTDTARAVTAAGVTAHVDDRYQYVFMNHFGNAANGDMSGDDWLFPKDGQSWESFDYDDLTDTVANEATTFTLPRLSQGKGIIVPYDCTLEGVYGSMISSGNIQGALSLWTFTPAWGVGGSGGVTATRRMYATGSLEGATSNYTGRPSKIYALGGTTANVDTPVALTAGDSILPSLVCPVDGETTNIKCSFTIVLKVKLPDL